MILALRHPALPAAAGVFARGSGCTRGSASERVVVEGVGGGVIHGEGGAAEAPLQIAGIGQEGAALLLLLCKVGVAEEYGIKRGEGCGPQGKGGIMRHEDAPRVQQQLGCVAMVPRVRVLCGTGEKILCRVVAIPQHHIQLPLPALAERAQAGRGGHIPQKEQVLAPEGAQAF